MFSEGREKNSSRECSARSDKNYGCHTSLILNQEEKSKSILPLNSSVSSSLDIYLKIVSLVTYNT